MRRRLIAAAAVALSVAASPVWAEGGPVLCGLYSYANSNQGVASFGTVAFDGAGKAKIHIKVNAVSHNGNRTTREVTADGIYSLGANMMGEMTFDFTSVGIEQAHYDFVVLTVAGGAPRSIMTVLEPGGVNGQLVVAELKRLAGCAKS